MKQNEDIQRINDLIDRYFDATTSLDEERELRRLLAATSVRSPKIDEARAVMGLMVVERKLSRRYLKMPWRFVAGIAASVAVVLALGVGILSDGSEGHGYDNQCVAYTGASEISNAADVMSLFDDQLRMIDDAATALETDIAGQLSVIAEISTQ